jgi:glutamyl-tRNA synthetase
MNRLPRCHKTRIAPTPSGYLHLGNALSFAITASLAKRTGAGILLRIDDLDQQRARREFVQDIFDTLRFLGIKWHEGPYNYPDYETTYKQALRMELYQKALQQLRDGGHLFACTCSRTQVLQTSPDGAYPGICCEKNISLDTPGVCWRLHTNTLQELRVRNLDSSVTVARLPIGMQSFVVRRKDGAPAYQLASLIDDIYFGVDLVVRGADLWPSTLAQLFLASLLQLPAFPEAYFYHHAVLNDTNGRKLSKSDGAESVRHLRTTGRKPSDIYALMARCCAEEGMSELLFSFAGATVQNNLSEA